jgi:hypothetical protein
LQLSCCLRQVTSTSNNPAHPCKCDKPSFGPPCGVDNGKKWRRYIFQYYHDGAWWTFDVPAFSQEDAQARINKISFAQYVGEHFYTIKAGPGSGLLTRLICTLKNGLDYFRRYGRH